MSIKSFPKQVISEVSYFRNSPIHIDGGAQIMPKHNFKLLRGSVVNVVLESTAIQNNILGDSSSRQIAVYLPEGYESSNKEYPLLVDIAGFTGSGLSHVAWQGFGAKSRKTIG